MSDHKTYAVVTVTDHRTDPPREHQSLTWWRDARERRCGIAGAAHPAFTVGGITGPSIEIHWGGSEWAPAQVFIGDQFAADLEVRPVDAEHYKSLAALLAGEPTAPASDSWEWNEDRSIATAPVGTPPPIFSAGDSA